MSDAGCHSEKRHCSGSHTGLETGSANFQSLFATIAGQYSNSTEDVPWDGRAREGRSSSRRRAAASARGQNV
eukprot:3628108-Rhodomonas_salina.1